jgi:methyl coenzyme M reductase alpha subunit
VDEEFELNIERTEPTPNHEASAGFEPDAEEKRRPRNPFGGRRSRTTKKALPKAAVAIPNRKGQFKEPLMKLYAALGTMVVMGDPICGAAIIASAEKCAEAVDQLAYENEAARRAIWMLTQTSTLGMVLVAHMPIIMTVAMHHVPRMQEAFGQMGANMMEDFLKQATQPNE